MNDELLRPFTQEKVDRVVRGFHPTKARDPDGFPAVFYQKYWDIVGNRTASDCFLK